MLIHQGLWVGDFEITASAIQLGEPPGRRGVGGQCAAHKAGLQGALPCCPCLVAPMLVAACSRLQLEWPASLATGQLRSPQDLDTAPSSQEAPGPWAGTSWRKGRTGGHLEKVLGMMRKGLLPRERQLKGKHKLEEPEAPPVGGLPYG